MAVHVHLGHVTKQRKRVVLHVREAGGAAAPAELGSKGYCFVLGRKARCNTRHNQTKWAKVLNKWAKVLKQGVGGVLFCLIQHDFGRPRSTQLTQVPPSTRSEMQSRNCGLGRPSPGDWSCTCPGRAYDLWQRRLTHKCIWQARGVCSSHPSSTLLLAWKVG